MHIDRMTVAAVLHLSLGLFSLAKLLPFRWEKSSARGSAGEHALFEISVQSQVNLHYLHLQRRWELLVLDFQLIDPTTLFVFRKKKFISVSVRVLHIINP
jgi:hypothetical protein